jgi:ribose 5-phosphate isomerase B
MLEFNDALSTVVEINEQSQQTENLPAHVNPNRPHSAELWGKMHAQLAVEAGACIVANKVPGVRACLIHESFSAHPGVGDDDMNVICLGGRVVALTFGWELVRAFLQARFNGAERHRRRLAKIAGLESGEART